MSRLLFPLLAILACTSCAPVKDEQGVAQGGSSAEAQPEGMLEAGAKVPDFSLKASDDKDYTLASMTGKGPAFVYVVKSFCSANPTAAPLVASVFNAYEGKVAAYGLTNGDKDSTLGETKQYDLRMPMLLDERKDLIGGLGLEASQHVYVFAKDGTIAETFHGYGKESLTALNLALAKAAGVEPAKIDLSGAPSGTVYG